MDKKNEINIGVIGKLIIPKKVEDHITHLHQKVGSTEWSGVLVYKKINGNIKNFKDLEFEAIDVFLMDIGSSTYTEIQFNNDIVDMYDKIPDALEASTGLVH